MPPREWLPASLGGEPKPKPTALQSIQVMAGNARNRVQDTAHNVGLPVSPATDSACYACCPNLTFKQRVYGTLGCFAIGMAIGWMSWLSWMSNDIPSWAVLYSLGNVVSFCSSGFMFGPKRQLRNITKAYRRITVGVYFSSILLCLIGGFMQWNALLLMVLVCVQSCALIWYIASYIPFGQKMITKILGGLVDF